MDLCIVPLVYLINQVHYSPHNHKRTINSIAKHTCYYSKKRELDPILVTALIAHESGFKPKLKSKTNDIGLMQLHYKYIRDRCNPFKIKCNIKTGTRKLARFKNKDPGKHHWLRRYNWFSKTHHLRVLWISAALKRALEGHTYLFKIIKQRKYQKLRINYKCIGKDLCGQLRIIE